MTTLEQAYRERYEPVLKPLAAKLETLLREHFDGQPRIDRIAARAKGVDRFLAKAEKINKETGKPKYSEPLDQIQDQIGARVVTFYLYDVHRISSIIDRYYRPIEQKTLVPESHSEFGYFGKHYVLFIPTDVSSGFAPEHMPRFFELQIKTLFQHAWSEAEHDLGYKPGEQPLTPDQKRRFAFTSAQAWGADRIFDELYQERTQPPPAANDQRTS